jgi:hypothetical protein
MDRTVGPSGLGVKLDRPIAIKVRNGVPVSFGLGLVAEGPGDLALPAVLGTAG